MVSSLSHTTTNDKGHMLFELDDAWSDEMSWEWERNCVVQIINDNQRNTIS